MDKQQIIINNMLQAYFELDDKQESLYVGLNVPKENKEEWDELQELKIALLDEVLAKYDEQETSDKNLPR